MKQTGLTVAAIGVIQLVISTLLLIYVAEMSGASFSHYWEASGWQIWYPQYVAGVTLVVVGGVLAVMAPRFSQRD